MQERVILIGGPGGETMPIVERMEPIRFADLSIPDIQIPDIPAERTDRAARRAAARGRPMPTPKPYSRRG